MAMWWWTIISESSGRHYLSDFVSFSLTGKSQEEFKEEKEEAELAQIQAGVW